MKTNLYTVVRDRFKICMLLFDDANSIQFVTTIYLSKHFNQYFLFFSSWSLFSCIQLLFSVQVFFHNFTDSIASQSDDNSLTKWWQQLIWSIGSSKLKCYMYIVCMTLTTLHVGFNYVLWWGYCHHFVRLLSIVVNISHFDHLLWNYWDNWDQTLQEWCLWDPFQKLQNIKGSVYGTSKVLLIEHDRFCFWSMKGCAYKI
jgi:hypothetical protein